MSSLDSPKVRFHLTHHPTRMSLVELWMQTHHGNVMAAVFFDPLGDAEGCTDRIATHLKLSSDQHCDLIQCNVFIHLLPGSTSEELCEFVDRMDQDVYGYAMAWDGSSFILHN